MAKTWRSLRSRILLLAVLTCLFLSVAAFTFITFLRNRQAAVIAVSEHHLAAIGAALAQTYLDHGSPDLALSTPSATPPATPATGSPALPPPPPPPPGHAPAAPADPADPLARLTARTLRHENGVEGGFFAAGTGALVGYSFPTHEGPGSRPKLELPQREIPTIEKLAREAIETRSSRSLRFEGPHDAVLFFAAPLRASNPAGAAAGPVGAVWLMQRIPGFNGAANRQLLLTSLGFGIAALLSALLAVFVTAEVRGGVNVVLDRLRSLDERGLAGTPAPASSPPLQEFADVLDGIDRLALSLDGKIAREKLLEAELRHKERLSALGQFAAGVAHELRNPLATIRLRTQMSQRSTEAEAVSRNSTVILEEVDRLNSMIERLLSFSRPILLHLEPVSVSEVLHTVAAAWAERAAPVRVSAHAGHGLDLLCDRSRLIQVLDNLVENAVQAAIASQREDGGEVELTARPSEDGITLAVLDNGSGFAPTALRHALDPFFTTRDGGTGLGLSIASELVQAHNGTLHIGNRAGGGASVEIFFPAVGTNPEPHEVARG